MRQYKKYLCCSGCSARHPEYTIESRFVNGISVDEVQAGHLHLDSAYWIPFRERVSIVCSTCPTEHVEQRDGWKLNNVLIRPCH